MSTPSWAGQGPSSLKHIDRHKAFRAVPMTLSHIEDFLTQEVRQEDRDEWFAAGGGRTMEQTLRGIPEDQYANQRACLDASGRCVALWGVTPDLDIPGVGICWMVATEEASRWGIRIHKTFKGPELKRIASQFACLSAVPMASNHLHHVWLERLGFEFLMVVSCGVIPFYLYARR